MDDQWNSPLYPTNNGAKRQRNQSYCENGAQADTNGPQYRQQPQQQNVDPNMRPRAGSATYRALNPNYKAPSSDRTSSGKPPQVYIPPPQALMQAEATRDPSPTLDPRAQLQKSLASAKTNIGIQLQDLKLDKETVKWTKVVEPICVYSGQSLVKLGLKAALTDEAKPPKPPIKAFVSDEEFYAQLGDGIEPPSTSWNCF